jgi:hypothetical protein
VSVFRLYEPDELGPDGYPPAWHRQEGDAASSIKVLTRLAAGNRCVRCGHPWGRPDELSSDWPEWSDCDEHCQHGNPFRILNYDGDWATLDDATIMLPTGGRPRKVHVAKVASDYVSHTQVQARWRILTVHHLDMNKANCRWWNLAALCQVCHLKVQGRVKMQQVYPYEHSPWFRPYAAGYYAFTYLGEELTREQTMARLNELLALERGA